MENSAENQHPVPDLIPITNPATTPTPTKKTGFSKKILFAAVSLLVLLLLAVGVYLVLADNKAEDSANSEQTTTATTSAETKDDAEASNGQVVYVTAVEGLNLREEASTEALIVLLLPLGTALEVISSQGDWHFVQAQTRGYVHKDFVSETKPQTGALLIFNDKDSAFKFLYPDVYKISLTKVDNILTYSFTGNESFGGFKVETVENMATLGNYALKNYPQAQKGSCEPVRFGTQAKECERVTDSTGTTYLLLVNTTLYKISYLKTEGGLLTDLNNLVFYSIYFD